MSYTHYMVTKRTSDWPHTLTEKGLFGFLYLPSYLLLHIPRSWSLWIGRRLGDFFYLLAGYRKDVVTKNLKIAFPDKSDDEIYKMNRLHFQHLGNMFLEYLWSPALSQRNVERLFILHGREHYDRILAAGKGGLILGSHMGSGDMGIIACNRLGYPMSLVGKTTRVPWVTRLLFGLREIHGVRALPEKNVAMEIFRCLKRNELVIFVMDQFMGPPQGTETFFFGRETGTTTSLAVFSERTGLPVLPVYTYRDDKGQIHIVIGKPIPMQEGKSHVEMTQLYNDELERMALKHPVQWFWVHQRWKKFVRH